MGEQVARGRRVLFVDDEPMILDGLRRQLRTLYQVETAVGGQEGLQRIAEEKSFPVVVADMRMPGMDGVAFLREVMKQSPESVRIMLTGNADQQTAIDAVNDGNIFRFLTKPCPFDLMTKTLDAAFAQYRLVVAERELMEGTLKGSMRLLMDILAILLPVEFGHATALRVAARRVGQALGMSDTANLELATMFGSLAAITLPSELLAKLQAGSALTDAEQQVVGRLPEIGARLLANIPRLAEVAQIVRYQEKRFDGGGFPEDAAGGDLIPLESRVLKVLHDFQRLRQHGLEQQEVLERITRNEGAYDPMVVEAVLNRGFASREEVEQQVVQEIGVEELRSGQVLLSPVESKRGKMLLTSGHVLTEALVQRIVNHHRIDPIKEPVRVRGVALSNMGTADSP